jgi:hypothetical protein
VPLFRDAAYRALSYTRGTRVAGKLRPAARQSAPIVAPAGSRDAAAPPVRAMRLRVAVCAIGLRAWSARISPRNPPHAIMHTQNSHTKK